MIMKKILLAAAAALLSLAAQAQKPALDHSVYDGWTSVQGVSLSSGGRVVTWQVNPQEGDGNLFIRVLPGGRKSWKSSVKEDIVIPRGYKPFILDNERFLVCLIKVPFKTSRQERIDKVKAPGRTRDSIAVVDLASGAIRKWGGVSSFEYGKFGNDFFAFASADTCFTPGGSKDDRIADALAVYHFADGSLDTLKNVDKYGFSRDGKQLFLLNKVSDKTGTLAFYDLGAGVLTQLADTCRFHGRPSFDRAGTRALFLQADDEPDGGSRHCNVFLYDASKREATRIVASDELSYLPEGFGVTENSRSVFSENGERIIIGIQKYAPDTDTTLVSFETPGLDIWNWDAPELPPFQKSNLEDEAKRDYPAIWKDGRLIPLGIDHLARISFRSGNEPEALLVEYVNPVETQWDIQTPQRISLVNMDSGARREIATGRLDSIRLSPEGRYVIWWDLEARSWFDFDVSGGEIRNLTAGIDTAFWEQENDSPVLPDPYGLASWTENDAQVLLYDRYDIWLVPAGGAGVPVRLTRGREGRITYRYINTKDREEDRCIHPKEVILLSVFDNGSKENGLAQLSMAKPGAVTSIMKGGYSFNGAWKARNAETYAWQRGNFRNPYDLYVSTAIGKKEEKLSAINPQIDDYNWGTAELYHWTAFDGRQLEGLLYKPEDLDESRKYPVIVYFYEKNSENLYTHYTVQPIWSIINIPFYVSRGYVVFVPDIEYTPGIPGESAYNCIVSGAQSLLQFPWVDGGNMAIQGQSWGGYQVAYLITRTDMFKAAGAGAPVANMTSAYGGIRWESGMSRQFQYEQTQSRIGRDLWSGIELYMENSPLFKLPNVTTPVLIMHNDKGGAVPWYQGIELFMGLRRLGKPAWLLEYNDEAHNLRQRRNRKDLSIRMQQFFDHYLKGSPAPAWMTEGVPTAEKGYYFGYELPE